MKIEDYKFDHFENIDEVMYYFNYWYKEEDVYSINRYLSLKDFNYISNKYQELQNKNKKQKEVVDKAIDYIENHIKYECDNAFNGMQFYSYHLYDFNKQELLDILKEVSE